MYTAVQGAPVMSFDILLPLLRALRTSSASSDFQRLAVLMKTNYKRGYDLRSATSPRDMQCESCPFETRIAAFEPESCVKKDARGY